MGDLFWDVVVEVPALGDKHYTYRGPQDLPIPRGAKVKVPFGASNCDAYVVGEGTPPENVNIKAMSYVYDPRFLPPPSLLEFGEYLARRYCSPLASLWSCFWPPVALRRKDDQRFETFPAKRYPGKEGLGRDGWDKGTVIRGSREFRFDAYVPRIVECLKRGKSVLMLLPEIGCVPYASSRLEGVENRAIHSELTGVTRRNAWLGAVSGEYKVALGTRSAAFLPMPDLGLIVVDEEESDFYKCPEHPFYHGATVARLRAAWEGADLLLGTPCPSVTTYHFLSTDRIKSVEERVRTGVTPVVVDLKASSRSKGLIAPKTQKMLEGTFSAGANAFLFLNRRGDSTQVTCEECGHVLTCPECKAPLVRHYRKDYLVCHTCGKKRTPPDQCPECGGHRWRFYGFGIERVEREFRKKFPGVPVVRLDSDTAKDSPADPVPKQGPSCLLGTAKAFDYSRDVSFATVAVLSLDNVLNMPDFLASEKTFALLCRLKGLLEEGEGQNKTFILQTLNPDHHAIKGVSDPGMFYEEELANREILSYPPHGSIFKVTFTGKREDRVQGAAFAFAEACIQGPGVVLGPAPAPKPFVRGNHIWQVALRSGDKNWLEASCREGVLQASNVRGVRVSVDAEPVTMT